MKALAFLLILLLSSVSLPQSGRRAKEIKVPVPTPEEEVSEPKAKPRQEDLPPVTAEKNEDYRCTDDGTLARIIDPEDLGELVMSGKEVDTRAVINSRPKPSYTKEARRMGVQGFVVLRLLLSARAKIGRIRVVKGLPAGLTENAIRAACKMEFKPAMKGGQPVAQWVVAEYIFRLADSSIFSPYR